MLVNIIAFVVPSSTFRTLQAISPPISARITATDATPSLLLNLAGSLRQSHLHHFLLSHPTQHPIPSPLRSIPQRARLAHTAKFPVLDRILDTSYKTISNRLPMLHHHHSLPIKLGHML